MNKDEWNKEAENAWLHRERELKNPVAVSKIQTMDLKKGDVLLISVNDDRGELPRKVFDKLIMHTLTFFESEIKKVYGDKVQIIFIPNSMDVSVLRLEEWFV